MRKALIESATGKVANVIEWAPESNWQPPAGYYLEDAQAANIGDTWNGVEFNPRQPTPKEIATQANAKKQVDAQARAVQAIEDNATGAPWGKILYDLAVAQGWIAP